jgi:uncharacterized damage-inducible protein DinB
MSNRDFYAERLKAEAPAFVKVLRALPSERADYRPHPGSRTAAELAWLLAASAKSAVTLVDKHKAEWTEPKTGGGLAAAADALDNAQRQLIKRLASLDDKAWEREVQLSMGGDAAWKAPLGEMLWGFLFDGIHHRGQLSTYIRPMGGKVPSIYGPSGDDPGR